MTGTIRNELIRIKLTEMEESVELVQRHLPGSLDPFLKLGLVKDGIYKRIEFAIEHVFDICAILNTDLRLGIPGNDEDIFDHLQMHGILSRSMRQNLKAMKGFRNIVVHRYGQIDDRLAYAILMEHINDFRLFRHEMEDFLRSAQKRR
jgi:uncharacterized protein YutE (UPF0331/DUF86 family)